MKKISGLFIVVFLLTQAVWAQPGNSLAETGKTFLRQGDYSNAVLVLERAAQQEPKNIEVSKNLALAYYYKKDNAKALEIIKPLLDREDGDDQSFQIAANIYQQLEKSSDQEKTYKKGIKRFPTSGPLYNELGEFQYESKKYTDAVGTWEKGIQADPVYSRNYYNAAKFYYFSTERIWSIIYGEMFINMEPNGANAAEIKQMLFDSYKKFFTINPGTIVTSKSAFAQSVSQTLNNLSPLAGNGITVVSLDMIRTRFILDWFAANAAKTPFKLFDYQQQLLKEGMFEAYNQWLFGPVENTNAYQNWLSTHAAEANSFTTLQKSRMFKPAAQQYYH